MSRWEKKKSRVVARSTFFTLTEDDVVLPDGTEKTYSMLELPDFAGVLPVVDEELVLVKNYRYPIDEKVIELPAGFIEEQETPEEAVKRELEEETGYVLDSCKRLCDYHPVASLNDQTAYLFIGEAKRGGQIDHDRGEDIEIISLPIEEVYDMLDNNEITHPHTTIALYKARNDLLNES